MHYPTEIDIYFWPNHDNHRWSSDDIVIIPYLKEPTENQIGEAVRETV